MCQHQNRCSIKSDLEIKNEKIDLLLHYMFNHNANGAEKEKEINMKTASEVSSEAIHYTQQYNTCKYFWKCVLTNLRYVWLDNNKIAGLQANAFDGSMVPKLSKLYLRNNRISVIESKTFVNMPALIQVYRSNNDIQKIEPDAFEYTPLVQLINLDSNYLSKIPRLGKLKSLKSLFIQANLISNPTFPDEFRNLKKINDIGLSNNAIRTLDDLTFRNLQNSDVRKLGISRSQIDEISTGAFKWLRNITSLKLGYNPLASSDLEMAFHGLV
ncbi:unnamed protein product [Mytilus edulis]|uniref:Uncharacterized protein n=1 Tax=Mytilus edulis TaxID=6550 RepID=A0A8S3UW30_MYTED|nr:unnamed protein product [Mytilus edulis]